MTQSKRLFTDKLEGVSCIVFNIVDLYQTTHSGIFDIIRVYFPDMHHATLIE